MAKDLTGRVFGHLTVLAPINDPSVDKGSFWWCRCSCGKRVGIGAAQLLPPANVYNCSGNVSGETKVTPLTCRERPKKLSDYAVARGFDIL